MSEDKFTLLCSDTYCIHNGCEGVYGICTLYRKLYGYNPPIVGMVREYRETCELKEEKERVKEVEE
jgi:hypothetical protein